MWPFENTSNENFLIAVLYPNINMTYYTWLYCIFQSRCVNQIDEVCKDIEKTINQTIQNTLNTLEKDCESIAGIIDQKLQEDK